MAEKMAQWDTRLMRIAADNSTPPVELHFAQCRDGKSVPFRDQPDFFFRCKNVNLHQQHAMAGVADMQQGTYFVKTNHLPRFAAAAALVAAVPFVLGQGLQVNSLCVHLLSRPWGISF